LIYTQILFYCICSEGFLDECVTCGVQVEGPTFCLGRTTFSMSRRSSSWVMTMVPSGHFFWSTLSILEANEHTNVDEPSRYNLKFQRADHDTGIRELCFSLHHLTTKTTYLRGIWDPSHLDLLTAVIRVARKRFYCSSDAFDREKAEHCPEII
jgi:hypothetical protein